MRKSCLLLALLLTGSTGSTWAQALTVTARQPAANARAAARAASVSLTFSQAVAAATAGNLAVYSAQQGGKKAGTTVTANSVVTFDPTTDFKPGETLSVTVPASLQSAGGTAAQPHVYQFTTAVNGDGSGNFSAGSTLTPSGVGTGIATGDLDGDGDLDLVTSNPTFGTVETRLNTGTNTAVFGTLRSIPVGITPGALALADVDGDADLDLLVANAGSNTVSVRLNGGNNSGSNTGIFSGSQTVTVGASPQSLAVGDIDGDGDLDLLTGSRTNGTVSIRLNGGSNTGSNTGIFSGMRDIIVAAEISALALGDIDADGDLDLLANSANGNTVIVSLNTGINTGTYTFRQNVEVGRYPAGLALGDIDGDGDLDLLTSNSGSSSVSVSINSSGGFFSLSQTVPVGATPGALALADVDADSDLDLICADASSAAGTTGTVVVRLNGGSAAGSNTGQFANGFVASVGRTPAALTLGDVDGDQDVDLLTSNTGSNSVSVRLNQPPPPAITAFSPSAAAAGSTVTLTGAYLSGATLTVGGLAVPVQSNTSTSLTFIVPSGASPAPLVVTNAYGSTSTTAFTVLFRATATTPTSNGRNVPRSGAQVQVTFSEPVTTASASNIRLLASQSSGRKSGAATTAGSVLTFAPNSGFKPGEVLSVSVPPTVLSAGGIGASSRVFQFTTVAEGSGRANFQPGTDPVVNDTPHEITLADVDGDGDLDLLTADYGSGNGNGAGVLLNSGDGTFNRSSYYDIGTFGSPAGVIGVTAADVDNDGDLDMITANANTNTATVLLNDGRGHFATHTICNLGGSPRRISFADLDGDGDLDLLAAHSRSTSQVNTVSIRFNDGRGIFLTGSELILGQGISRVVAADVDNDGDLDVLVSLFNSNSVAVRLNAGDGTFTGSGSVAVGAGPFCVTAADVDADGDVDLLTANNGATGAGNTVSVRLNDGQGNFAAGTEVAVGTGPSWVTTADLDADGDLDLLTANYGTNTVSIRLNAGNGTFSGGSDPTVDTNTFTGRGSFSIATGDVDDDGDIDFVSANSGNTTAAKVSVRLNQPPALALLSFSPASGAAGTVVTITGTGFTGATGVTFNGVAAAFTVVSATQITATVPTTATTGLVTVTGPSGTSTSAQPFTVSNTFVVSSVLPVRNRVSAPLATAVSVSFDQPLSSNAATLGALRVLSRQAGGRKAGTATVAGNTLTFSPTTPFKPGETLTATLTTAVQSLDGRNLPAGQVFQFTTGVGASSGNFPPLTVAASVGTNPFAATSADMNGDGYLDLITLNAHPGSISIRFNNGQGIFSGTTSLSVPTGANAFAIADVDNDGDLDVLATNNARLAILRNTGTGTFSAATNVAFTTASSDGSYYLETGDVNADGFVDVLIPDVANSAILILRNNQAGSFTSGGTIMVGTGQPGMAYPGKMVLADVDRDGDLDCVVLNGNPGQLVVRLNNGNGVFSGSLSTSLTSSASNMCIVDVNGDNLLDALVGFSTHVQTLYGTGGELFTSGSSISVGLYPRSMVTGDIDGDGDIDLVTANVDGYALSVRVNNGSGQFSGTTSISTRQNPFVAALADLDGDTDLDLAMAHYTDSDVSISLNPGTPTPVRVSNLNARVALYPNPAHGSFSLDVPAVAAPLTLQMRNSLGQTVRSQVVRLVGAAATLEFNTAGLAPGLYTLHGQAGEESFTKKVVLQ
ncbi:FG-GAP-like repeat-containing protein [Hymenobacter cellulosivorans]|uniref:FG-GAP-like repeat-containing protein n=1 Tax=Hymenobacter cellulosivorans TaxID=2932249 RepID=A0ABY4F703_9BACT|nr:FG-GAP-like repeat-containing protein [Hymenobacter cellulosivorans]UOQ52318.1 FG-GAP-like repeat-containing protein [Hymenobacter cellulosivorans]